jgi:hypothetical protein
MPLRTPPGDSTHVAVELRDVGLMLAAESTRPAEYAARVEILREGSFDFGTWSEDVIKVDSGLMGNMLANYAGGARGLRADGTPEDLPIDIDHETRDAAGWINDLSIEGGKLYADIKWNAHGIQLLAEDRFRFMSVMFSKDYTDPEGRTWGVTLWGAAMTNYPRIQNMAALTLNAREIGQASEPTPQPEPTKGDDMDTQVLAKALGLADDATEEQMVAAATALIETPPADDAVTAAEVDGLRVSIQVLEDAKTASDAEMATLKASASISTFTDEGRLTPGHLTDAEGNPNALAKLAESDLPAFEAAVASFPVVVDYGVQGSGTATRTESGDPTGDLDRAITAKMAEENVDHDTATDIIGTTRPELMAAAYPDLTRIKNTV